MILGVEGITPVWQVEAPRYPRNKFYCLASGGAQNPRCWSPGVGIGAAPRRTPRLLVPREFSTEGLDGERKSRFPRKRNKILDSSDHLLIPNSSNILPSPSLAGCRSSTRLPWPGARAGRGRGPGCPRVWRSRRSPGAPPGAARRAQSRRRDCQPPGCGPLTTRLREASGNHSRIPWLAPPEARS